MSQAVLLSIENQVATITLNRPNAYNSVNEELATQLIAALTHCKQDKDVRCIILTGAGKAFCSGQDLKEVTSENRPEFDELMTKRYTPISTLLHEMDKPIIAAVNGVAAGAGANFALNCDIVLASENASFIQAFSSIGLIPDSGGTYILPRLIGMAKAKALMMLGEKVNAWDAVKLGMIYKAYTEDTFVKNVTAMAERLANMPTLGLALTKQALRAGTSNSFAKQLELEMELQLQAASSEDYQEGVQAFIEKRPAKFKGK